MDFNEFREQFTTVAAFREAYGKLTYEEARKLVGSTACGITVKAAMMSSWRSASNEVKDKHLPRNKNGRVTYLTGETEGFFKNLVYRIEKLETNIDDVMVILGGAGVNFHRDKRDKKTKMQLAGCPITFLCVHGEKEVRPESISSYKETTWRGGTVFFQKKYPNILFAKDGETYDLNGKKAIVLGGASCIDKEYRIERQAWWPDGPPSAEIIQHCFTRLEQINWKVDYVFSHTCPFKYIPMKVFPKEFDWSGIDRSTEEWLDSIENRIDYSRWYCGRWHEDEEIGKMVHVWQRIRALGD